MQYHPPDPSFEFFVRKALLRKGLSFFMRVGTFLSLTTVSYKNICALSTIHDGRPLFWIVDWRLTKLADRCIVHSETHVVGRNRKGEHRAKIRGRECPALYRSGDSRRFCFVGSSLVFSLA